jgi:hypothetical protein
MADKVERKNYSLVVLLKDDKGYYLEIHDITGFKYRIYYINKKAAQDGLKIYGAKSKKIVSKA